jgi:hypothetical protein
VTNVITAHVLPTLWPHAVAAEVHLLARRAIAWQRAICCAVHGHELLLHFERNRICLRCAGCGFETRGWCIERARHA